jgi:hypothetical protein
LKPQSVIALINKYAAYIIAFFWAITTIMYYNHSGLFTQLEAEKYIKEADRFIQYGNLSLNKYWFYSTTILLIILSIKLQLGLFGAFIIQALINLCAYLLLYKALKKIHTYSFTALLIIVYLLIFWPYQSWIVFLYTESIFFSFILILLSLLIMYQNNKNSETVLFILLALILVIMSRPLGILFIIPTCTFFFIGLKKKAKIISLPFIIASICIIIYATNIVFSRSADASIILAASQQCIICGIIPQNHLPIILQTGGSPLYQLYFYITNNFSQFLYLGGIKLKYFFIMTRTYYSTFHNAFLLAFTIPVYILFVGSLFIKKEKIYKTLYIFIITLLLLFCITIMTQCDDYHNRFILSIYPFFVIFAAKTIEDLLAMTKK